MSMVLLNAISQAATTHSQGMSQSAAPLTTVEWIALGLGLIFGIVMTYFAFKGISKDIPRK